MNGKMINLALANGTGIMPGIFKSSLGYAELEDIFKQERYTFMVIACASLDGLTNLGKYMVQVNKIEGRKIYCELVDSTSEEKKLYKPLLPTYDDTVILTLTLFDNEERFGNFLFEYPNNIGPEFEREPSSQEDGKKTVSFEEIQTWQVSSLLEIYRNNHLNQSGANMCTRLETVFSRLGTKTVRDLLSKTKSDIYKIPDVGQKTIKALREMLENVSKEYNLTEPLTLEMLVS